MGINYRRDTLVPILSVTFALLVSLSALFERLKIDIITFIYLLLSFYVIKRKSKKDCFFIIFFLYDLNRISLLNNYIYIFYDKKL
jgi:hypothetical protein